MRKQSQNTFSALSAVTGVAGVLLGVIVGYIIGVGQAAPGAAPSAVTAAAPAATSTPAVSTVVSEAELKAYRDILASDPKNAKAAVELANKLYDAGRYAEAIPYYQQAVALDPKNANVNTDLGTALYYAGRADDALVQLGKSLEADPKHGQTLYNIGIIKRDAKRDPKGAVEAWERLLRVNPDYPEAARVRTLIAETK